MEPAVSLAERGQTRLDDRPRLAFGRGAVLFQREEERERFEAAELAGEAIPIRLADGAFERGLRVAEPVRAGESSVR